MFCKPFSTPVPVDTSVAEALKLDSIEKSFPSSSNSILRALKTTWLSKLSNSKNFLYVFLMLVVSLVNYTLRELQEINFIDSQYCERPTQWLTSIQYETN